MMVCLGNICRSPTAHGLLRERLVTAGLGDAVEVASSGLGTWHLGAPPDPRAQATAAEHGIDISDLRAQKITVDDLDAYDYVIAMDHDNHDDLMAMAEGHSDRQGRIHLLGDFSPQDAGRPVGDPYYGGDDGFTQVFEMIDRCVAGLVAALRDDLDSRASGH
tara:strand:+ start:926 stop:1411 length:486 start_codon:yes stop_codon:yes gene_type:complete